MLILAKKRILDYHYRLVDCSDYILLEADADFVNMALSKPTLGEVPHDLVLKQAKRAQILDQNNYMEGSGSVTIK